MQMLRDLGELKAELSAVKAELAGLRERIDDVVISNLRDHGKRMSMLETRVAALEAAENRRAGGMAIEKNEFDKAKLAKITAETLKIRQEAERKAWGIRDVDAQPDGGVLTVRILRVSGE